MDIPNQSLIDTVSKVFAYICIIQTVSAVILNPLILIICLKSRRLRSTSTFKILAVSAVNDMLVCLAWNQEGFTTTIFNYSTSYSNLFYCRWISVFLQYTTFNIQSWILLSISVDRLLSMVVKKWSKFYFAGYRPYIFAVSLCFFMAAINFHEVFTSGYSYYDSDSQSDVVICYTSGPNYNYDWYIFAAQFYLYFGFIAPVSILFIVNLLIIYKATQYSRSQKINTVVSTGSNFRSEKRKAQMTRMILFITFLYIVLSMPNVIIAGYFFSYISSFYSGQMIINILNSIQFTYPSFHIFILFFSNKLFANEVKAILLRMRSNHVGSSSLGKSNTNPTISAHSAGHSKLAQHSKHKPEPSHRIATDVEM